MKSKKRLGLLFIAIAAGGATIVGLVLTEHDSSPSLAPVVVMKRPYVIPHPKVGLLDRVMPRSQAWGWLWSLRYALFGRNKSIDLDIMLIDLTDTDAATMAGVIRTEPDFTGSDGLQVWRLRETRVRALQQQFKGNPNQILASPRMTTGNGTECQLYCGNSVLINGTQQRLGLTVNLLPSIRKQTTDLIAVCSFAETVTNVTGSSWDFADARAVSLQTNLDFAGRFQLTEGITGVFVLPAAPASANHKRIALLLRSSVLQPKK